MTTDRHGGYRSCRESARGNRVLVAQRGNMSNPGSGPGPDRRSVTYWAGWAAIAAVVVGVIAIVVAHDDAKPEPTGDANPTPQTTLTSDPATSAPSFTPDAVTTTPIEPSMPRPTPKPVAGWASAQLLRVGDGQYDVDTAVMSGKRYPESVMYTQWGGFDGGDAEFNLGRQCSRFKVTIGFDDGSKADAVADLKILADGRKIWSRSLKFGARPVLVDLNVAGVLRLTVGGTYDLAGYGKPGPAAGTPEVLCDPVPTKPPE